MAPLAEMVQMLRKRQLECDSNGYNCGYNSGWDNWGRWVALVVIIIFFVLVAGLFSRRRRRLGRQPMYGTGWIPYNHPSHYANHPSNQNNPNNPNYQNQQNTPPKYGDPNYAPPPPYQGQQSTGQTFNSADGYYGHGGANGGQGIELQQPSSSYQPQRERMGDDAGDIGVGGSNVYDAPVGPPPAKGMWGSSEARVVR